ncbi:MAG: 23S rRNA (adenine(2503)-C(2))-methyltransferase RlmN [Planctomycetota bacterium]|jgi:23S rRNA (adenine2503-C2)-methyltransferase
MVLAHLRDLAIPTALHELGVAGAAVPLARRLVNAIHQRGVTDWEGLGLGHARLRPLQRRFRFGPLLDEGETSRAEDGTRKYLFRTASDDRGVEVVLVRNRNAVTLCLSSQAGCALGCTFCATAQMGLERHLTAGEITEAKLRAERAAGVRVSDVVFMGQGEPLHNYDAVMDACTNLNHDLGPHISRKRITISTVGLTPQIRRYARERRRWRLHLSLHSAIQATRAALMPIAHTHPLPELLDAMREYQRRCEASWVTLQYVAIPGVNMDRRHVDALRERLAGLRCIINVIPYNDTGAFRPPTWAEVKEFTTRLRALGCPVKVRYSAGKRAGMGCGQLSAETYPVAPSFGHALAPPGIFTG